MKLIIVSNRLPARFKQTEDGRWKAGPSSGGLVTAMTPVLQQRGGLWIGWPGTSEAGAAELTEPLDELARETGYELRAVSLSAEQVDAYYRGFSNEVLWPLFHDLQSRANFDPAYWNAYQNVNRAFADVIVENADPGDVVWIHDYHLMSVVDSLRERRNDAHVEFFLHTPFPSPDIFGKLPWRSQILRSLLAYDATGFQTERDRDNYLRCVAHFVPDAEISGSGRVRKVRTDHHVAHVGAFPISIDFDHFASLAASDYVQNEVKRIADRYTGRHLVLGVDRLDYTKGIRHRLRGFARALEKYPELTERISLVQLVVPSRRKIPEYAAMKTEIDRMVGEINGAHTRSGWIPVHYLYRGLPQKDLVALYRASRTMLVTPLKDGMNLVSKEYCAAHLDDDGALILSEFAGSAAQLGAEALCVNPYDSEGLADTIYQAYKMAPDERRQRMRKLREKVAAEDIFWWVDTFLDAARA